MPLLTTHNLTAFYGDFQALFGVDIELNAGETIAIIGANGAGKTSLMRSISGVLSNVSESVMYEGSAIGAKESDAVMRDGIAMVPEGRKLFPSLSVKENLLIGTYGRRSKDIGRLRRSMISFQFCWKRQMPPPRPFQEASSKW